MSSHPSNDPEGSEPNKGDDTNVDANGNSSFDDADSKLNRSKHGPPNRPFKRSGSQVFLPRLINRNLPYHQSTNQIQVKNKSYKPLLTLMWRDWFHILLRTPPYFVVPLLLAIWTVTTVVWAQIYVFVDRNNFEADCGLGEPGFPIEFGTGFAFSLITVSTVGCKLIVRRKLSPEVVDASFLERLKSVWYFSYLFLFSKTMFCLFLRPVTAT